MAAEGSREGSSIWRYVLGALLLHVLFMGVFGLTMVSMARNAPPPQLAIQAVLVDPGSLKPDPRVQRAKEQAEAQRKQEQKRQQEEKQRDIERERRETEQRAEEQRQLEARRREEQQQRERQEEEQRQSEAKAKREAAAEAERKRVAEIERKQKERDAEQRKLTEARAQEARESELQRQLEEEEGQTRLAQSGVVDRYRALIEAHIYRYWNRPPSARAGIQCSLTITQAPGGTVLSVKIGECNGDGAMRQSIENAVLRASPLPPPPDPRAFERIVILQFKPQD